MVMMAVHLWQLLSFVEAVEVKIIHRNGFSKKKLSPGLSAFLFDQRRSIRDLNYIMRKQNSTKMDSREWINFSLESSCRWIFILGSRSELRRRCDSMPDSWFKIAYSEKCHWTCVCAEHPLTIVITRWGREILVSLSVNENYFTSTIPFQIGILTKLQ